MQYIGILVVQLVSLPELPAYHAVVEAKARISNKSPRPRKKGFKCEHVTVCTHSEDIVDSSDNTMGAKARRVVLYREQLKKLCLMLQDRGFDKASVEEARASANYIHHLRSLTPAVAA